MPQIIEDTAQRLIDRIQFAEPRLTRALTNAVTAAKDQAGTLDELAVLIGEGRSDEAVTRAVNAGAITASEAHAAIYVDTGLKTAAFLGEELGVTVGFDQVNRRAVRYMRQQRLELIREWSEAQRMSTRIALTDGIQRGANPIEQARAFRDSVGLTGHQQRIVQNFRASLEAVHEGNLRSLTYELRDHRFDPTILRAQRETIPLSQDRIEKMVGRYRERFIKYRAEVIARTEALRAVHAANHEAYLQGVEEGHLEETELKRTWVAARDSRVRESHLRANGQKAGMRERFEVGGALLLFPGDPAGPAREILQCRCVLTTRVQAREQAGAVAA